MKNELDNLYQEMILDHNRNPRNFKQLPNATTYAHGLNPLCGDDYHLYLAIDNQGVIQDVGFQGSGCAISKSSASLMTQMIKLKNITEAEQLKECFHELVTKDAVSETTRIALGRLKVFEGVKQFPVRVKCAMLIWRALEDALRERGDTKQKKDHVVTTEEEEGASS